MAYATDVPVIRLAFSDGFKYYGDATVLTPSVTVNLSVPSATHRATGEVLTDGQTIPAQDIADFNVPRIDRNGWATPGGSTLNGWSYDVSLTITATGQPTLVWSATINPGRNGATITPGLGRLSGASSGGASGGGTETGTVTVTETAPGEYTIGA